MKTIFYKIKIIVIRKMPKIYEVSFIDKKLKNM